MSKIGAPKPEDYMPLVQQSADINRLDQSTPFGGTKYIYPDAPETPAMSQPMNRKDWTREQSLKNNAGHVNEGGLWQDDSGAEYNQYLSGFTPTEVTTYGPDTQPDVEQYLSPELQTIFNNQFDPNAYQNYADDSFAEYKRLLDPVYEQQGEQFRQRMANRGQPVGGELYDDMYGNMMDAQNRGWQSAAYNATQAGEQARLQDFNRLMSAMGGSQVAYPGVDTMGAANMAMNADIANAQNSASSSSNLFNTLTGLGSSFIFGNMLKK